MQETIAIIGNGCAGSECITTLRKEGFSGDIHLFSNSFWPTYNPMLTSRYLSGKIHFDDVFGYGCNFNNYKEQNIKLHIDSEVIHLDSQKKIITNNDGYNLKYDKCLIASGAKPFIPPIEGINNKRVFILRTIDDALALKKILNKKTKRVVVVGASMIGVEVIEALIKNNINTCLADMSPHIFPLIAHKNCANIIEKYLTIKGVDLRFNAALQKIVADDNRVKVYFGDSPNPEVADYVVACLGVRPNIGFIDRDQVNVDRGIIVDDYMQTNVPDLYAAGDITQGREILSGNNTIVGLWPYAQKQGKIAALNMLGKNMKYQGNLLHNTSHFLHFDLVGIGNINTEGEVFEHYDASDNSYIRMVWQDKMLKGVNILNKPDISGVVLNSFTNNDDRNVNTYAFLKNYIQRELFVSKAV